MHARQRDLEPDRGGGAESGGRIEAGDGEDRTRPLNEPAEPVPSDVPLPPRRNASVATTPKPQASLGRPQHVAAGAPSPLLRLAAAMEAAGEK